MNEYQLAKAKTTTKFDKAYEEKRLKLLEEIDFVLEGDEEEVDNYIEDNTHPDN